VWAYISIGVEKRMKENGAGIDGKGRRNDFCLYRAYQQVGISRQVIAKIRAIVD